MKQYERHTPLWMHYAACRGHDTSLWFMPSRGREEAAKTRQARAICRSCPCRTACLEYALDNGIEFGLWGGTSERQRRRIRGQRLRARNVA